MWNINNETVNKADAVACWTIRPNTSNEPADGRGVAQVLPPGNLSPFAVWLFLIFSFRHLPINRVVDMMLRLSDSGSVLRWSHTCEANLRAVPRQASKRTLAQLIAGAIEKFEAPAHVLVQ